MSSHDYSPTSHASNPPMLEASTSEPARPPMPSDSVEGLTLSDASAAYGLSVSSLRRLLKAGKLIGASKVAGPKGSEYRIPGAALEALGYRPRQSQAGALLTASRASLETEQLSSRVRELEASLETERALRSSAEREAELLRANLEDLRVALSKLPPMLEAAPRSRWWRKKPG